MSRGFAAIIAALALAVGCKKKREDDFHAAVVKLRDAVCACKTIECTHPALAEIGKHPRIKELTANSDAKLAELNLQTSECLRKLGAATTPAKPAVRDPSIPAVPAPVTADALVRAAREWANAKYPGSFLQTMTFDYVDASGALDAQHGELRLGFGAPQGVLDDPNRRTGTPVVRDPKRVTVCPNARWLVEDRWHVWEDSCADMQPVAVKCTVESVWQAAIAQGAPADAVARVTFDQDRQKPWSFTITDEPRNVRISYSFADDCELAVEKP